MSLYTKVARESHTACLPSAPWVLAPVCFQRRCPLTATRRQDSLSVDCPQTIVLYCLVFCASRNLTLWRPLLAYG